MRVTLRPWLIWGLGAFFFFSEYFVRISPSVMAPQLMDTFGVTGFALGSLSAYFYIAYLGMQIPVGLLIDKYGIRKLLTLSAFICGLGALGFGLADNIHFAELCRFLIGFGAAFAFVSALKLALIWLPQRWFGLLAGITQALGMLGASVGDGPMSIAVNTFGWRHTMIGTSTVFFLLAILIFCFVKDRPHEQSKEISKNVSNLLHSLKKVFTNKRCWANAAFVSLLYAPTAAFAELWGVSFLTQGYQMQSENAAFAVGLIFIGWGIGGPTMGLISDRIGRRKPLMLTSALCGFIFMGTLIYCPGLSNSLIYLLLFLYGLTNAGVSISYAVAGELCSRRVAGTSLAFANISSVIIGAGLQPVIGHLLDLNWSGKLAAGAPVYSLSDYRIALFALPLASFISLILLKFIKETYCERIAPESNQRILK